MESYFKKYKESRILLLSIIEKYETEERLNNKEDVSKINEFNLKNIKNKENKEFICNTLNIKNDILTKDDAYNIIKSIKTEHQKNIDYQKEYYKILLGYISIVKELYFWKMTPEIREKYGMYPEYIESDIDKDGNLLTYYNFNEPLGDKVWEVLDINKNINHIPKSMLDEKENNIINKLNELEKTL